MNDTENHGSGAPVKKQTRLGSLRMALLATTVAGIGAAAIVAGPMLSPQADFLSPAHAQNLTKQTESLPRPVGFADIVEKVKPAVISVRVKVDRGPAQMQFGDGESSRGAPGSDQLERFFRRFGSPEGNGPNSPNNPQRRHQYSTGQGSGFFISADGYAVTNNHVVDKAETVEVKMEDGRTLNAKVIGTDARSDLALIKVEGSNFPYVNLGEKAPRIGDWVLAVGNPFGLGGTVTAGIVSARGRDIGAGPYDDFIQIDAPVNKGNSGGPTFDVDGNVIGVNTAIFSPSGGSVGIAFAIPAETVKTVIAQLKDRGSVTRGWIGVQIQPVSPEIAESLGLKNAEGALVAEPQSGGPAVKAGIEAGDVITSVNGQPVKDARDLARRIGSMPPGATVKLVAVRKGAEKNFSLTLGELPAQRQARAEPTETETPAATADIGKLGFTLAPAGSVAGAGSDGVVVTKIDPDGLAAGQGVKTGDVILDIAGKAVSNPSDVSTALATAQKDGKRSVLLRVKSGEGTRFLALPVGRA
ncbi:MAG: serine peptidase [Xanthobacteraceae bacterium]|nr:serine peptidase [Xanthobacteraceae bacterium]